MPGYFELVRHDPPGQTQEVSEREARRLLAGHVRDTRHALQRLRAAPYGVLSCDGGALRYCPTPELWIIDEAHHVGGDQVQMQTDTKGLSVAHTPVRRDHVGE